jgi:hypothetical protein
MLLTEFIDAWAKAYMARTGLRYRATPGEVEFIIKSDKLGLLDNLSFESFSEKAIDYLASRKMKVTARNALDRFNEIALHQKPVAPAHETFDAEGHRKMLEEISGTPLDLEGEKE